jgi:ribonucleoside-diphosphate reductase alpha chain
MTLLKQLPNTGITMSTSNIRVAKRTGQLEDIDLDKIHKVLTWARSARTDMPKLDVSESLVELQAHIQFYDGMKTETIHETLIKAAADQISEETPDYQFYAGILGVYHIRKKVFRSNDCPHIFDHVTNLVDLGKYDRSLLVDYTREEFNIMEEMIDHERDKLFTYAAYKQLSGKYLVQNRVTGDIYETPQFLYMLVAACLFSEYPKDERLGYVKRFYDATSLLKLSLPTPIMGGVRTPTRQFSSCVLIESDDSLDSINAASGAIVKYVSQRAGIGINAGRIRGLGSPIRGGEAFHTGMLPFIKHFKTAVKSCSQGGIRGGAATLFYPLWHIEAETLLVLKNNKGTEESRERQLDYGVQMNGFLWQRVQKNLNISLFSPSETPGLYDAFFADQDEFARLYTMYEADTSVRRKTVKAFDLISLFAQERAGTGRIYLQHVDHCNTHGAFNPKLAPVRQSNLCLEIALPTKPLKHTHDPEGEIALCTLAAFNLGLIEHLDDFEELADLAVRALDSLLDYQDYPLPAAEKGSMLRRSLGIGVVGFAHYLAKHGVRYSDGSANKLTHETFEAMQYYLLKASNNLAKEKGTCLAFDETSYAQGLMPIDTYKSSLDKFADFELLQDWDGLRKDIAEFGLRNSTVTALMPSETSSQMSNATSGIDMPRGFITIKSSKDGAFKQVVPDFKKLKGAYELLWDDDSNHGYMKLCAIMQKFVDQTISTNTRYDPSNYPGGKVPIKLIISDMMLAYSIGIKTLYYHNTRDGQEDGQLEGADKKAARQTVAIEQEDDDCAGGACKI